ncbi:MAG: hypothetical protein IJK60_04630 [Clostridia bacterium]|nr:hypothetical protein [Clostridia bacterium]
MTVIYIICKILTFPGAYLRGFLEHIVAKLSGCYIESDGYIRMDEVSGHTDHSFPLKKAGAVAVAFVPGIFHFAFGLFLSIAGLVPLAHLRVEPSHHILFPLYIVITYIGVSMLCNLCPLVDDALFCKERLYGKEGRANLFVRIIMFIPTVFCVAGAYIERYSLNILIIGALLVLMFIN